MRRGDCPRSTDRTQNLSRSTILDPLDNFLPVGTQSTEPPKESDRWGGHPEIDFLVEEIHGWVGFRYWCHFICRVGCTGWTVVILMVPVFFISPACGCMTVIWPLLRELELGMQRRLRMLRR